MATKRLAMAVQLEGLDGADTQAQHSQLSVMLQELKRVPQAVQHLLSSKYILEVTGGPRHPELASIHARLSPLYEELGDLAAAEQCIKEAHNLANDLLKKCHFTKQLAAFCYRHERYTDALQSQHNVHLVLKELLPEKDERLVECEANMKLYMTIAQEAYERAENAERLKQGLPAAVASKAEAPVAVDAAVDSAEDGGELKKKKRHAKKNRSKK